MGIFAGHALPGAFFITFGLWWLSQTAKRDLIRVKRGLPYWNTLSFPCLYGRYLGWPIEPSLRLVMTAAGSVLEMYAAFDYGKSNTVVYTGDLQHVTMYLLFGLAALAELLVIKQKLPPGTDYLIMAFAFSGEALLFYFHLHGRSSLDVRVHTLLVAPIIGCAISVALEAALQNSVLISLSRTFFLLLQGTWFIQIGFILHNPIHGSIHWEGEDHKQIMMVTLMFAWHAGAVIVFMLGVFVCLQRLVYPCACPVRGTILEDECKVYIGLDKGKTEGAGCPMEGEVGYSLLPREDVDN